MQVHGNDVRQPGGAHHSGQQFRHDASSFAHLALLGIRQVRDYPDDGVGRGSFAGVRHDEQLHDVVVDVSAEERG